MINETITDMPSTRISEPLLMIFPLLNVSWINCLFPICKDK